MADTDIRPHRIPVLEQRALNRALLARQHLLDRAAMPALDLVEHLVGVQAQAPLAPYVGLWSRLAGFRPAELAEDLTARRAVRISLMRGTVHLVSARDCLGVRPVVQPAVQVAFAGHFRAALAAMDLEAVLAAGRDLLAERPRTRGNLRDLLAPCWPDADAELMAYAVGILLPTVQTPPRGVWGAVAGRAELASVESWLGRPVAAQPSVDALVRRYLAAFGPASVADVQRWSGLTRLAEVVQRIPGLRRFRDGSGRELFDVPEAPLPDPDLPAPVRFLPEYDNVLLSHADRSRVIPDGRPVPLPPGNGATTGTVLVDGTYRADWRLARAGGGTALEVTPLGPVTAAERDDLAEEAARLATFLRPAETVELRITGY